jgi:hypothetical protein
MKSKQAETYASSGSLGDPAQLGEKRSDLSRAHLEGAERDSLFADPVFILGVPRSFSWLICAMIGQHSQLYALPELQLFSAETMNEWFGKCAGESFPMADGLLRAVAELFFGGQSESAVVAASGWLNRRSHCTTGFVLEEIIERACPRMVVEKSPGTVYHQEYMQRMLRMFPRARFIHLTRHPIWHGQAVLSAIRHVSAVEKLQTSHWLLALASARWPSEPDPDASAEPHWDPQAGWYALNLGICEFLKSVPAQRQMHLRGEDLSARPHAALRRVAEWLGIGTDPRAIKAMKHPRWSPFARYGPARARYGVDLFLSDRPFVLAEQGEALRLDIPLPWFADKRQLRPEVKQLAQRFGYG